jgi:hypothetical protein
MMHEEEKGIGEDEKPKNVRNPSQTTFEALAGQLHRT